MINDDFLIHLVRENKRQTMKPASITFKFDPQTDGYSFNAEADIAVNVDPVHYTMDVPTVMKQVKMAALLAEFERKVQKIRIDYCKRLDSIYGPLMADFRKQYDDAFRANPKHLFDMQSTMAHVETLAKEMARREDKDEAIFDAKRIENELNNMEFTDGDKN